MQTDQNPIKIELDEDGSFTVKEFTALNVVAPAIFYIMFLYGLFNTTLVSDEQSDLYDKMLWFALAPAIFFTLKAKSKRVYIRINSEGIYINDYFLSDWAHFVSAEYTQGQEVGDLKDKFILIINYYREYEGYYVKEVPLTNTQNKAEEEVIAAINHFYTLYKEKTALRQS